MNRVFVPMVPSRYDRASNLWLKQIDLSHAATFGKLVVIFRPEAIRSEMKIASETIKNAMLDFTSDDYLLPAGDPRLISISSVVAAQRTGGLLRLLVWDRFERLYKLNEVTL